MNPKITDVEKFQRLWEKIILSTKKAGKTEYLPRPHVMIYLLLGKHKTDHIPLRGAIADLSL